MYHTPKFNDIPEWAVEPMEQKTPLMETFKSILVCGLLFIVGLLGGYLYGHSTKVIPQEGVTITGPSVVVPLKPPTPTPKMDNIPVTPFKGNDIFGLGHKNTLD